MTTHKKLVLSGMQPTNTLHLGNYLGALKNWVRMQSEMPCLFCVVDMHALTQESGYAKPQDVARATREVAAAYMAAGVDPTRTPIFNQSRVAEHAELAWIFNCVARLGWLDRMTQFKEKSGKHKERSSVGLYTYPVLMAADILVYKATHVPVGEDQKQHLELARDIAQKFNNDYSRAGFFPAARACHHGTGHARDELARRHQENVQDGRVRQFAHQSHGQTPTRSRRRSARRKPIPNPLPDTAKGLEGRPEAENLINIYAGLAEEKVEAVIARFAGQQFSGFKNELGRSGRRKAEAHRGRNAQAAGRSGGDRPDAEIRCRPRPQHRDADHG